MHHSDNTGWRQSSRCETAGCVEVAHIDDHYLIRDSKNPDGPQLTFTAVEWAAFVASVRDGEFDFGA